MNKESIQQIDDHVLSDKIRHRIERAYELIEQAESLASQLPRNQAGRADVIRCIAEAKHWAAGVDANLPEAQS